MEENRRSSIGSNWAGRLLLSLTLAIALWAWVTTSRDPETTKVFSNIAVSAVQLQDGLVMVGDLDPVNVSVTGPRSVVNALVSTEVSAELDLADISKPGSFSVQVHVAQPEDIWSTTSVPRSVSIVVEEQVTRGFPVSPVQTGSLNSNQQVEAIIPNVSEVAVSGPASLVDRVVTVELPVDIENKTTDFAGVFTPEPVDQTGQIISGLSINPESIAATVEITARGKRVAVIAQITGDPSSGYEVVDRLINPGTVLVDGPADTIANLITVSTDIVDIQGAQGDVTQRVDIVGLPEGVTLLDPQTGQVDVVVQIRQRGVQQPLPSQQVNVVNLASGMTASVEPNSVLVTVIGSERELETLSPASLIVQVDASGLTPGTYQVKPTVILPPNMEWTSIEPNTVTITIVEIETVPDSATPEGSPVATPSP